MECGFAASYDRPSQLNLGVRRASGQIKTIDVGCADDGLEELD